MSAVEASSETILFNNSSHTIVCKLVSNFFISLMIVDSYFKQCEKRLRFGCPLNYPVRITRPKNSDEHGSCELKGAEGKEYFLIRISKQLDEISAVDTLIHEWAHALCEGFGFTVVDHGPEWGICYARCYCVVHDER